MPRGTKGIPIRQGVAVDRTGDAVIGGDPGTAHGVGVGFIPSGHQGNFRFPNLGRAGQNRERGAYGFPSYPTEIPWDSGASRRR